MIKRDRFIIFILIVLFLVFQGLADVTEIKYGCFKIIHELTLPGTPALLYDAISGDISDWWDHSFSEAPYQFYIEPKPGGGFYEIFDESGDGVLHATVIVAERGKLLRFDGPLGLSGRAINIVHTYEFSPVDSDSTHIKLSVNIAGEIDKGMSETIERVWHHFLFEQFKPYIEEDRHLLVTFEMDGKWGYQNNTGKVIIPPTYYFAGQFNKYGIAAVVDDSGWVYITMNEKRLLKPYLIDNGPDYFNEGLARFISHGKMGFMDERGTVVVPAIFDFVLPFSEGLAAFCAGCRSVSDGEHHRIEDGKWGFMNKTGEIVVDPEYDRVNSFKDGYTEVVKGGEKSIITKKDIEK